MRHNWLNLIITLLLIGNGVSAQTQGKTDYYFPNMDIRSAFKAVSTAGGVDIVLSPELKGNVNLEVTQKTWQEVLDVLCHMFDLNYDILDNYIFIKSAKERILQGEIRKLYKDIVHLKYVNAADLDNKFSFSSQGSGGSSGDLIVKVLEKSNALLVYGTSEKIVEFKDLIAVIHQI